MLQLFGDIYNEAKANKDLCSKEIQDCIKVLTFLSDI